MTNPFLSEDTPVCPQYLIDLAVKNPPAKTAIVRAGAGSSMEAAKEAFKLGIMQPVFIGEADNINREADKLGWDISKLDVIQASGEADAAKEGARLGSLGEVDVVMKGNLHTDVFMGALVRKQGGIRTHERMVHVFHIADPKTGKAMIISDGAVNVSPNLETRKVALQKVDALARKTGIDRPKIAILSATETPISSVPSSMEAAELSAWAAEHVPTCDVRGPLALDLILSQKSADTKGLGDDPVAGKADGIIVPDIVSGNALFKAIVYLSGGCAGGIVLGGKVPVLLTSRADPPAARLASSALASIMRA